MDIRHHVRKIARLAGGNAIGQVVPLVALPLLTHLYGPEAFGIMALLGVGVVVALPLALGRFDLAIVPSRHRQDALTLLFLCVTMSTIGSTLLLAGVLVLHLPWGSLPVADPLGSFGVALPMLVLGGAITESLRQWYLRLGLLAMISRSQVIQAVTGVSAQVGFGLLGAGPWGLIAGQIGGLGAAILILAWTGRRWWAGWLRRHRSRYLDTLWRMGVRHRRNPLFLPWGGMLDALGQQLPVLALSLAHGPAAAGYYAMADRALKTPLGLMMQPAAQISFRTFSGYDSSQDGWRGHLRQWALLVLALGLPALLAVIVCAEPLISLVLGETWRPAGKIAVILAPLMLATSLVSPVSCLLIVAGRQKALLALQISFFLSGALGLLIGRENTEMMVFYFTIFQFSHYIIYGFYLWHVSGTSQRS